MNQVLGRIVVMTLIVAGLLTVVAAVGWAADDPAAQVAAPPDPGFPVKVGVVLPLSGDARSYGDLTDAGLKIALDEATQAGWSIETVYADSKCDSQEAVSVTEDLIVNEGVHYIIGAACSSASIPMSEVAEEHQVVQISPISTNPRVTKYDDGRNKEYVFRACLLDPFQAWAMAQLAREDLGASDAAVLYDRGNAYVSDLAGHFKAYFEDVGGSVPVYASYTAETTDFSHLLTRVEDANADVLFVPDLYTGTNKVAAQADAMGLQTTFLGADAWDSTGLRTDLLEGAYFSTHFWPEDPRQVVVDFVEAYSARHETQPRAVEALGYDAAAILLRSIAEAGVDDPTAVKDAMADLVYEGATGQLEFNPFGDPIKGAVVARIEGGETKLEKYVAPRHVTGLSATNDGPTDRGQPTTFRAMVETGDDVTYTWGFEDGTVKSGRVVSRTYETAGLHAAVVTATNEYNTRTAETVASVRETVTVTNTESVTTSDEVLTMEASPDLTQTVSVTYTPQTEPTNSPGDFEVAGGATFHLDARDEEGGTVTSLSHPITMTVRYDGDALPAYLDEEDLSVRRYDGESEAWVELEVRSRDLENDRITVILDHFSEFAVLGHVERQFLPLVVRGS